MSTSHPPTTTTQSTPSPGPADSHINTHDSINYWNSISPDVNGMLGGFPQVSRIDLQGSRNFITKVQRQLHRSNPQHQQPASKKLKLAVDCGAGIGRITNGLLMSIAETVDAVEPIAKFAAEISSLSGEVGVSGSSSVSSSPLKATRGSSGQGRIGEVFVTGLEAWEPGSTKRYDVVWNQWCLGHLTDSQLVEYLERVGGALSETGWIMVKENLSTDAAGDDLFDEVDSSVTRSDAKFKEIFERAGLVVLRAEVQTGFPKGLGLYPVKMYALRPR